MSRDTSFFAPHGCSLQIPSGVPSFFEAGKWIEKGWLISSYTWSYVASINGRK